MGRLIDTDALLGRISLNYNNHQNITAGAMKDMINTTPTAYDAEKVVEELEEAKSRANRHFNYGEVTAYNNTIEIVRKGGVE